MFIENQPKEQLKHYERLLKAVGSLSRLFSTAQEPYLPYRATESLFCKAFDAENISRGDVSADAFKNKIGFGIKTFLYKNGTPFEKIAEFNKDHAVLQTLKIKEKIRKIAELRNERMEITKRIFGLEQIIYHCITRRVNEIFVYETPAPLIKTDKIKIIKNGRSSIRFSDDSSEIYSFSESKSTLYKQFIAPKNALLIVPVRIFEDPFDQIEKLINEAGLIFAPTKDCPHVFLPLYSVHDKKVFDKSGLNQWNAGGRLRDPNEIYIPIPSLIRKKFPKFFPPPNHDFELILPNRTTMRAKVCQDNNKAIMSNPNSALGKWLLRDVLNLPERELLDYEKLQKVGLDAVVIYKINNKTYDIDFARVGSYEEFLDDNSAVGGEESAGDEAE